MLQRYQAALKLKGDAKRGRAVFEKNCASCHRVGNVGTNVGPDVSDTRTKQPAGLLTDVLDPNRAIDNNFVRYQVRTKRGQVFTGIVTTETASSLTLVEAEKEPRVLLLKDVESVESSGVSFMPEGLEKDVSLQQMADLLSYLKNWRYLDNAVPLTPKSKPE